LFAIQQIILVEYQQMTTPAQKQSFVLKQTEDYVRVVILVQNPEEQVKVFSAIFIPGVF